MKGHPIETLAHKYSTTKIVDQINRNGYNIASICGTIVPRWNDRFKNQCFLGSVASEYHPGMSSPLPYNFRSG